MDKELLFGKTLEAVRKKAKEQGNVIAKEDVELAFAELDLSEDQLALVYEYLKKHKIGIGEPVDLDDYLEKEDIDYLALYLEELKGLPQLSEGQREAVTLSAMAVGIGDVAKDAVGRFEVLEDNGVDAVVCSWIAADNDVGRHVALHAASALHERTTTNAHTLLDDGTATLDGAVVFSSFSMT